MALSPLRHTLLFVTLTLRLGFCDFSCGLWAMILKCTCLCQMGSKPLLLGRCIDLSKAYKQVAVATESLKYGVLGYLAADGDWRPYTTHLLLLGQALQFYIRPGFRSDLTYTGARASHTHMCVLR